MEGEFQRAPSADVVAGFCRRMLGSERVKSAREIGGGLFNTTLVITTEAGKKYAMRMSPPHDHPGLFSNERYLLRREYALGPFLASAGPLLPKVVASDFTCDIDNRDVVLSDFIEGDNWDAVKGELTGEQNDAIWRDLGEALSKIHSTRGERFGWPAPGESFGKWSEFILHAAEGLLRDFPRFGVTEEAEVREWLALVEQGAAILDEIKEPRLVHGDPWPKNVLIDRAGPRIVGLLDHERGLWGDPMDEWVFHQLGFPPAFWEAYGQRPTGPAAEFRDCVYLGLIDEQLMLEGVRFRYEVKWVRERMKATSAKMRRILGG